MIYKMYAIFDSAVEAYNRPFCARAHGEAIRMFEHQVADGDSPIRQNPEHFQLFFIGEYSEESAELCPVPIVCLAKAHEVVAGRGE
jgi:hypothetical protein